MLRITAFALVAVLGVGSGGAGPGAATGTPAAVVQASAAEVWWRWPVAGAEVVRPYAAPATRYGAGHRGVDLAATVGTPVLAPTGGVVVFVGRVVDRDVLTLDVGGAIVVTVEPVSSPLAVRTAVARGDPLGTVDVGGHALHDTVHLGVRADGEYVDPMRFYGGTPRAVLLPCC